MKIKKYLKRLCVLLTSVIALNVSTSIVSADANTLNIKVYFSTNECGVYGVPSSFSTRLPRITGKVSAFYKVITGINSGITIKFNFTTNNDQIRQTILETCANGEINDMWLRCSHWPNSQCVNGTISMPSIIHHTNVFNVMNQLPNSTTNYAIMLLTPSRLCSATNQHNEIIGACWSPLKELIVSDLDYTINHPESGVPQGYEHSSYNMAHEIGHLYGVSDHYDQPYGKAKDDCIWGLNRNDPEVYKYLTICSDCLQTINNNKNKYNHTPIT